MPRKHDKQPAGEKRSHDEAFPEQREAPTAVGQATGGGDRESIAAAQNGANEEVSKDTEVIVLHPGSSMLNLGLCTDLTPHSLPHIIAYKTAKRETVDEQGPPQFPCSPLPSRRREGLLLQYEAELTPELESQRDSGLENVRQAVREMRESEGMVDGGGPRRECVVFNSRYTPRVATPTEEMEKEGNWTDLSDNPRYVIGDDVYYLPPGAQYKVFKPLRRGHLNVCAGVSQACVLNQLEDLWTKAVEDFLQIPRKDFRHYRVILLVPDGVDRTALKEFMNVLLLRMEFAAALVHQESVCATYSASLSTACVVDVGDETTHICCVEDGMSNPNTRVSLYYGGADITRLLFSLIKQIEFPYKECSPDSYLDGLLVQQLKESLCHLDHMASGVRDHSFRVVDRRLNKQMNYAMKVSDECIFAPMGLFYPSVFCLPGNQVLMAGQEPLPPDSEDLFDEGNWLESQAQQGKSASSKLAGQIGGAGSSTATAASTAATALEVPEVVPEATKRLKHVAPGKILGLDQAVHFSIDCASSPEMKKKLYGNVLLIGGGMGMLCASVMLQNRLQTKLPTSISHGSDGVEVYMNPRDLDCTIVAWKGGAVLKSLDTCQELWIERQEWEFSGVRLLRERTPFVW